MVLQLSSRRLHGNDMCAYVVLSGCTTLFQALTANAVHDADQVRCPPERRYSALSDGSPRILFVMHSGDGDADHEIMVATCVCGDSAYFYVPDNGS